jgi:asparagine synthase (glutamine-hydrolysing)
MDDSVRLAHKRSVHAPQGLWFKKDPMRRYIIDLIGSESFADRGIFDVNKVKSAFSDYCNGNYDNSFFIWQWINMEEWHRMFIDKTPLHPKNYSVDNFYAH